MIPLFFETPLHLLVWLIIGHFIADYALQSDYIAKAKNRNLPEGKNGIWEIVMAAHASIHAGFVFFFTGYLFLAVFEFIAHFVIDTRKCDGVLTYKQDQMYHIACKVVITFFAYIFYLLR